MGDIESALDQIAARRPRIIDLSLDRVFAALDRLANPHKRLPPVFHVAGTNGKGSTIAFMRAMLEAAGKSVHVYTSPHLVRFNERIVLAGKEASDAAIMDVFARVDAAVGDEKLTYFETITCAAFLLFAETPADYLLLEVGLGGRLDATNVLDKPLAAVITPVDLDHQQFLGETIAEIAAEKAGIFRGCAPAVIGRQHADAMSVLLSHAGAVGAKAYAMGINWDAYPEQGRLTFQDEDGLLDLDGPRLQGVHQFDNAALAAAALRASGIELAHTALSEGIRNAFWPGRLQRLTKGPLLELAAEASSAPTEIWIDGGHNPHAGRAVSEAMAELEARSPRPLVLIAGMQASKDAQGFFENFVGLAKMVYTVAADQRGVMTAQEVCKTVSSAGLPSSPFTSVKAALAAALDKAGSEPLRILICGSLYLVGEILAENA
ncbi:MAG: folylpolyglutamate synthase/dihydrofolate synthase family protein [Pseudomonadota bacterium]